MTWLFTQVWLWSLASFLVGSLLTWLLFVRPAKKKLRLLAEQLAASGDDESVGAESTGLDLLPGTPDEEPPIGDWDRGPRSWSTQTGGGSRQPEPPAAPPRTPATEEAPERAPEWGIPDWSGPANADTREVERIPLRQEVTDRRERAAEPEPPRDEEATTEVPSPPTGSPSGAFLPRPDSTHSTPPIPARASQSTGQSTWFQKPEVTEHDWSGQLDGSEPESQPDPQPQSQPEEPQPDPQPEHALSPQLRSLFEPLGTPDPEAARADPIELGATQNIPKIEEPPEGAERAPLPRRTPGAGPKPGAQNLHTVAAQAQQQAEQAVASGQPATGPQDGYTIKGHFASRQYHTQDSPQYDRIVAEVWFRTIEDAEQAGFEAWNARTT